MNEINLCQTKQIEPLIDYLNHSKIFDDVNISSISPRRSYLKWFAPALDYPCISNTYYLFSPFVVVFDPSPRLIIDGEQGENGEILEIMKIKLLEAILHLIPTPVSPKNNCVK